MISEANVGNEPYPAPCTTNHQKSMVGEEFLEFLAIMSVLFILMLIIR